MRGFFYGKYTDCTGRRHAAACGSGAFFGRIRPDGLPVGGHWTAAAPLEAWPAHVRLEAGRSPGLPGPQGKGNGGRWRGMTITACTKKSPRARGGAAAAPGLLKRKDKGKAAISGTAAQDFSLVSHDSARKRLTEHAPSVMVKAPNLVRRSQCLTRAPHGEKVGFFRFCRKILQEISSYRRERRSGIREDRRLYKGRGVCASAFFVFRALKTPNLVGGYHA